MEDLIERIKGGWFDFDVAIAVPRAMKEVGKIGRLLGPRGKMPNPKVGTVTNDVKKAVTDSKAGKVAYRVDKSSNVHMPIGKVSFEDKKIKENLLTALNAILKDRPASVKGVYLKSLTLSSTMNPGIKLDVASATLEAKK
jgi:large subunit ribosomal protein L1